MGTVRFFSPIALSFVLLFCSGLMAHNIAQAQFGPGGSAPSLRVKPAHPAPHSNAVVSLSAYAFETNNVTVRWYIDGVEQQSARNSRSISVAMGELGTAKRVRADVSGDAAFSVSRTLTPSTVDVVIEANTTVPVFYKGRPLPSPESVVRVVAVPHVGEDVDLDALSYKWELDGTVLSGGAIRGKQSASFAVPMVGDPIVSVTVYDPSGTTVAKKSHRINTVRPELYFYKENPLRSTNRRAIGETTTLVGEEVTVRAEPYFMNTDLFDESWEYSWKLNNRNVTSTHDNPKLITFRPTGSGGTARIGFSLTNRRGLLQTADESFVMTFSGANTTNERQNENTAQ